MIIDVLFQAENLTAKYPFFKVPLVFPICDYIHTKDLYQVLVYGNLGIILSHLQVIMNV